MKYQDRYKIIVKDYPSEIASPNLWKKALRDMNATNATYISNQKSLYNLLNISDLVILSHMGSTFFDALYFDADIFVVDEDIFEQPFALALVSVLLGLLYLHYLFHCSYVNELPGLQIQTL